MSSEIESMSSETETMSSKTEEDPQPQQMQSTRTPNRGDNDPSVFVIIISGGLQGELQVTNGYGPHRAPQIMLNHWNTYIVEDDFKFISSNGWNAVRIPVGWWIASNPTPKPYVEASLHALDKAFLCATKYGVKIIIDLHAAPGSDE
ncbi:hypothetical protein ACB098_10G143800 [Castanea mollissima]